MRTAAQEIAEYVKTQTDVVFGVTGGCIVNVVDAFHKAGIRIVQCHHEQAAATMADGYARTTGRLGVCFATSGPGGQNLLTGLASAYYDRVPILAIVGQVPLKHKRGYFALRQYGFQETHNAEILAHVALPMHNTGEGRVIAAALDKRMPVVFEICDDRQRHEAEPIVVPTEKRVFDSVCIEQIWQAKKPVVILGAGCREAGYKVIDYIERLGAPVLLTWGAMDMLPEQHHLNLRDFGVTAQRAGNLILDEADCILALGTRLDLHEYAADSALMAKTIVVNDDVAELRKHRYGKIYHCDVAKALVIPDEVRRPYAELAKWLAACQSVRHALTEPVEEHTGPDAICKIATTAPSNAVVVSDAGQTVSWTFMHWVVQSGQRLFTAFNNSPMGYAVPAAVGAAVGSPGRPVICITGDGGLMMNIGTLANLAEHKNIHLHVIDNSGYGMIRQTQSDWDSLDDDVACSPPMPDLDAVIRAFGVENYTIHKVRRTSKIVPKMKAGDAIWNLTPKLDPEHMEKMRALLRGE